MMKLTQVRPVPSLDVRVIGVGGAGCASLKRLREFLSGDIKMLGLDTGSGADTLHGVTEAITIGNGFGSGGDPIAAADEFLDIEDRVSEFVSDADVVVVLAGLGRGAGSGISPLVARIAKESGTLTLAAINMPFEFEGRFRNDSARHALDQLEESADSVFVMNNDDLLGVNATNAGASLSDAFGLADQMISDSVMAVVTALEATESRFVEVRQSLRSSDKSLLLSGSSEGLHAGAAAVNDAFSKVSFGAEGAGSNLDLKQVTSAILHVEGGIGLSAGQVAEAVTALRLEIGSGADVHVSSARQIARGQQLQVTVLVAGDVGSQEIPELSQFETNAVKSPTTSRSVLSIFETPRPIRTHGPMLLPAG